MSEKEIKKQADLLVLKRLTAKSKVVGWCSNMWLNQLLNKYPWQYLLFTQFNTFKTGRRNYIEERIKEKWIYRLSEIQKLHLEEKDVDFLNGILDTLDCFIKDKKTINKN